MPVSRRRKKKSAAAADESPVQRPEALAPSPPWYGGLILAFFLVGILWLLVYYLSNGGVLGQEELGAWNLLVGFGFIVVGLGLATRWR